MSDAPVPADDVDAAALTKRPAGAASITRLGVCVALVTFVLDQASKAWMLLVFGIAERGRVPVLPFLDLLFVKNTGISYGLFASDGPLGQMLLAGFAVTVAAALTYWLVRAPTTRLLAVSLGLLIGGAIGNAVDRMLIGGVADFFLLHWQGYHWYVFNIADAAIVAGVIGLLYDSWRGTRAVG